MAYVEAALIRFADFLYWPVLRRAETYDRERLGDLMMLLTRHPWWDALGDAGYEFDAESGVRIYPKSMLSLLLVANAWGRFLLRVVRGVPGRGRRDGSAA